MDCRPREVQTFTNSPSALCLLQNLPDKTHVLARKCLLLLLAVTGQV